MPFNSNDRAVMNPGQFIRIHPSMQGDISRAGRNLVVIRRFVWQAGSEAGLSDCGIFPKSRHLPLSGLGKNSQSG